MHYNCGHAGSGLPELVQEGEQVFTMCSQCASMTGTCYTCKEREKCDFETNPIDLPKQIIVTRQQGNAVIRQQIVNPERIRETCQKNCECFSEEFGCLKQNGTCGKYKLFLTED